MNFFFDVLLENRLLEIERMGEGLSLTRTAGRRLLKTDLNGCERGNSPFLNAAKLTNQEKIGLVKRPSGEARFRMNSLMKIEDDGLRTRHSLDRITDPLGPHP